MEKSEKSEKSESKSKEQKSKHHSSNLKKESNERKDRKEKPLPKAVEDEDEEFDNQGMGFADMLAMCDHPKSSKKINGLSDKLPTPIIPITYSSSKQSSEREVMLKYIFLTNNYT